MRKIMVTSALPYANGDLHLGNMVEFIQTDIWVRFQRMCGQTCIYICGDDAHGTPIMLKAEKLGIKPEALIATFHQSHVEDLKGFHISTDHFYTTHSEENRELAQNLYQKMLANGDIEKRIIQQAYDEKKAMFLPDRYVKGTCPKCHSADQYGDNCEKCGATYTPTDLIEPKSVLTDTTPVNKSSEHFFFKLGHYHDILKSWIQSDRLQSEVVHKLNEWFEHGLKDWDISRDGPYFGINIPGEKDKFFYVWLDAPIGYLASLKNYLSKNPIDSFENIWGENSDYEVYHFIGKDIMYFHVLFWPAMLTSGGFRKPTSVFAHGFLTVDGQKMSKSRGTLIEAKTYLKHLKADHLRYYYAAKLSSHVDDIDLNFEDFSNRINADLVGKFVNIASRCAGFINKSFDSTLSHHLDNPTLLKTFKDTAKEIHIYYESREFAKAIRLTMALADKANQYIDQNKPWQLIKDESQIEHVHAVCTSGIHLFRILAIILKPVIPSIAKDAESFLNVSPFTWQDIEIDLLGHKINSFKPLTQRIDMKDIEALRVDSQPKKTDIHEDAKSDNTYIDIQDFTKIELRIAKILEADYVEGADALLKLKLDIGDETRQVFAGIKAAYDPKELIGRHTVMVANLKPRKMRFGVSEGMVILAVHPEKKGLWLLEPDEGAQPGMRVQ